MKRAVLLTGMTVLLSSCTQPGTQVSYSQAAKIGVATQRIAVACGYAYQLRAFGGSHPRGVAGVGSIAVSGARKLAGVYSHAQSDIYQGESVGAVVHDSISLLDGCGLPAAKHVLVRALTEHH